MKTSLYNQDGTLSAQAQSLLSLKPLDMSMGDYKKILKDFRSQLSKEEAEEFKKLKARASARICSRAYDKANRESVTIKSKEYRQKNRTKIRNWVNSYRLRNKEKIAAGAKKYYNENKEKINKQKRIYNKRIGRSPKDRIRNTVRAAFKRIGKNKPTNTLELLGCSWEEAKAHIESLWQEGMSWENHGLHGWHIDHIRPVSSFEEHELDQMNHISNLQPLWAKDNLEKSNKW